MPQSASESLQAYLQTVWDFISYSRDVAEAHKHTPNLLPELMERRERLLTELGERREAALLAGVRTGWPADKMSALLDRTRRVFVKHKYVIEEYLAEGKSVSAAVDITDSQVAAGLVEPLRDLEDLVKLARQAEEPLPPAPVSPSSQSEYVCRLEGKMWVLNFAGESGRFPLKGNKGLKHIAELLSRPYRHILGLELQGPQPEPVQTGASFQAVLDQRAQEDIEKKIKECQEEIAKARRNNDDAQTEFWIRELRPLGKELEASRGKQGQQRRLGSQSPEAKAWNAARMAMDRAISAIRKASMPNFASHLSQCIQSNSPHFIYLPVYDHLHPEPRWSF
jgi:hypothetical protein